MIRPRGTPPGAPARPAARGGRLVRRLLLVAALGAAVVLTQRGTVRQFSDRLFRSQIDWHNDYAMVMRLEDMIVDRHLTNVTRPCLLMNIHGGDPPDATAIDVYERPTAACMGDAGKKLRVLPRLFGLRVDRDTGTVATDAGTPERFHPLR